MSKMKLLEKKLKISQETNIFLPVYSEEAFLACGLGKINDFYDMPCVEDIAYSTFESLKNTNLQSITFGVIDEEYFGYLEENNLEDSNTTRTEYCASLNDTNRQKLWENNGYNEGYDWGVIPVILENPTYTKNDEPSDIMCNYSLSKEAIEKIKESLAESFRKCSEDGITYNVNKDSFYVAPHILSTSEFEDDDLIDIFFDEGVRTLKGEDIKKSEIESIQEMDKEEPIAFFGIFVLYKYEVPNKITLNYIENAKETTINFPTLDVDYIENTMEDDIDITFELLTLNIVYPEYIDGAIEEFKEYCLIKLTEKAKALETMNDLVAGHCKTKDKKNKKKK